MRKRLLYKLQEVNGHIIRSWGIERKPTTAPGELSIWPILTDIYFFRNIYCGTKMKTKATIDRFEEDRAVFILGVDEDEYIVPRTSLPQGVVQGLWLQVELEDHRIVNAVIDEEETAKLKERLAKFRRRENIANNPKD